MSMLERIMEARRNVVEFSNFFANDREFILIKSIEHDLAVVCTASIESNMGRVKIPVIGEISVACLCCRASGKEFEQALVEACQKNKIKHLFLRKAELWKKGDLLAVHEYSDCAGHYPPYFLGVELKS